MNEYYTAPDDIVAASRARSSQINDIIDSVDAGFDNVPAGLSTDVPAVIAEVTAARRGLTDLLAKITAMDAASEALSAGNSPLAEYIAGRFNVNAALNPTTTSTTLDLEGDLVYDTTPQLGGDLDLNGHQISADNKITLSDKTEFEASAVTYLSRVKLSDTEVFYAYQAADTYGYAVVVTWGADLTVSTPFPFNGAVVTTDISCCKLSATQICVAYAGADEDGWARVLEWDGADVTAAGSAVEWLDANTIDYTDCVAISSTKIAVFYHDSGSDLYGVVLSWSDPTLTAGSPTLLYAGTVTYIQASLMAGGTTATIATTYRSAANATLGLVTWDGTTLALGDTVTLGVGLNSSAVVALDANTVALHFVDIGATGYPPESKLAVFYHAGAASDVWVRNVDRHIGGAATDAAGTPWSMTAFGTGKIAVIYRTTVYELLLKIFSVTAALSIDDSSLVEHYALSGDNLKVSSIPRYTSPDNATIIEVGTDQLMLGYADLAASSYGYVEKIEVG